MSWVLCLLLAQPLTLQTNFIPPGTAYEIPGVGEVRYYLFEEYKLLLQIDHDLFLANKELGVLRSSVGTYEKLLLVEHNRTKSYQAELAILKRRADRLDVKWKQCEKDLVEANSRIDLRAILFGAAIGGVSVAVIATVLVVSASR